MSDAQAAAVPTFELRHRLARALEWASMSHQSMAEVLGCSRNTISNYLAGRTRPRKPTLLQWALATGVPAEWLMHGDESSSGPHPTGGEPRGMAEQQKRSTKWYARTLGPVIELAPAA